MAEGFVVTKVLVACGGCSTGRWVRPHVSFAVCLLFRAHPPPRSSLRYPPPPNRPPDHCPQTTAAALYERIRTVGLDPSRVYHVRGASIHRPSLDITLDDGTIAFTEDICGRITGAFFVGDGEILLQPPNRVERASLTLFTGMAILEEQLSSGYLRFNDDTAANSSLSYLPLPAAPTSSRNGPTPSQNWPTSTPPACSSTSAISFPRRLPTTPPAKFRLCFTPISSEKPSAALTSSGTPPSPSLSGLANRR